MRQDLIARYADERLPRYTSFPTAPHFTAEVGPSTYGEWLRALASGMTGSLYVHIPFCRRMCWYCGCNTSVTQRDEPIAAYVAALRSEIDLVRSHLCDRLEIAHLHFGGGTPTIVDPGDFDTLMHDIRSAFALRDDAEIAIEIDPRTLSAEMADTLASAGVNRASLGVQSLDARVQSAIGRPQTFAETAAAVDNLRRAGVAAFNIDLIYGLPHQTVQSCIATVEECLALEPNRFAVFGYAHVPSFKKHQQKIEPAALPGGPERNAEAEAIAERLAAAGYEPIGIDHYALPSDPLAIAARQGRMHRNFQGYTPDAADALIGLGASAIGRLPQGYVQNETVTRSYMAAIGKGRLATFKGFALSPADRLRAALIERLMCDFRVDIDAVCRSFGRSREAVADADAGLDGLATDGIVRRHGGVIEVAADSRSLVRAVAAVFDSYRTRSTRVHSPAL